MYRDYSRTKEQEIILEIEKIQKRSYGIIFDLIKSIAPLTFSMKGYFNSGAYLGDIEKYGGEYLSMCLSSSKRIKKIFENVRSVDGDYGKKYKEIDGVIVKGNNAITHLIDTISVKGYWPNETRVNGARSKVIGDLESINNYIKESRQTYVKTIKRDLRNQIGKELGKDILSTASSMLSIITSKDPTKFTGIWKCANSLTALFQDMEAYFVLFGADGLADIDAVVVSKDIESVSDYVDIRIRKFSRSIYSAHKCLESLFGEKYNLIAPFIFGATVIEGYGEVVVDDFLLLTRGADLYTDVAGVVDSIDNMVDIKDTITKVGSTPLTTGTKSDIIKDMILHEDGIGLSYMDYGSDIKGLYKTYKGVVKNSKYIYDIFDAVPNKEVGKTAFEKTSIGGAVKSVSGAYSSFVKFSDALEKCKENHTN